MELEGGEKMSDRETAPEFETEIQLAEAGDPEDEERRRLEEENEALRRELELMKEKNLKERLYDHVHVSVRTMDIFIGVMLALLVAVIVIGLLNK